MTAVGNLASRCQMGNLMCIKHPSRRETVWRTLAICSLYGVHYSRNALTGPGYNRA